MNDIFNDEGKMISIISFLKCIENHDIQIWAKNKLQKGNIRYIHNELKKIRGIGDKISSFYIRDIFRVYRLNYPKDHKNLLHPIDVWTKKGAQALLGEGFQKSKPAHLLSEIASKARIRDEDLNAGLWYYGAKICKNAELFQRSLNNARFIDYVLEIMMGQ